MSTGQQGKQLAGGAGKTGGQSADQSTGKRTRKQYSHTLTSEETYALHTVQRASSALRVINEAIRSGKKVNPDVVELCQKLDQAVATMLFRS